MRLLNDGERGEALVLNRPHRDRALVSKPREIGSYAVLPQDISFTPVNDKLRLESGKISLNGYDIDIPEIDFDIPNPSQFSFALDGVTTEPVVTGGIISLGQRSRYEPSEDITSFDESLFSVIDKLAIFGDYLIISDSNANVVYPGSSQSNVGRVLVFKYSTLDGRFKPFQEILPPEADAVFSMNFGHDVAIYNNTLVVGARLAHPGSISDAGAAYVYELQSNTFNLIQTLTSPFPSASSQFGKSVAIFNDKIAIAEPSNSSINEIHIFEYDTGSYNLIQTISSVPDSVLEAGQSLAMDGQNLFIGAHYGSTYSNGAVHVYEWNGTSYIHDYVITPPAGVTYFGSSIAIDSGRLLITSQLNFSTGRIFYYDFDNSTFIEKGHLDKPMEISFLNNPNISLNAGRLAVMQDAGFYYYASIYNELDGFGIPFVDLPAGTLVDESNSHLTSLASKNGILYLETWLEKISDTGKVHNGGFIQAGEQLDVTMSQYSDYYVDLNSSGTHDTAFDAVFNDLTYAERKKKKKNSLILNVGTDLYQLKFAFRLHYGVNSTSISDMYFRGPYTQNNYKYSSIPGKHYFLYDGSEPGFETQIAAVEILRIQL
jgi:hypothetical protein